MNSTNDFTETELDEIHTRIERLEEDSESDSSELSALILQARDLLVYLEQLDKSKSALV